MKAQLILENGKRFSGHMFGALHDVVGEIVFTTGMVGYQETITDPTHSGQIVVMTFPLIGNYGINFEDMEADKINLSAMVVREKCDYPSNFRQEMTLEDFLKQQNTVGFEGIDTRALTREIKNNGTMKAVIMCGEPSDDEVKELMDTYDDSDLVAQATIKESYTLNRKKNKNIAFLDLGSREALLRELEKKDYKITVFPAFTKAEEIMATSPDLLFVSNGPGNPKNISGVVETVKNIIGKIPVCGVGLGHLVTGLALGAKSKKSKHGHHGANFPVKNTMTGRTYITTQNTNFILTDLPKDVEETFVNINDSTCVGIEHKKMPVRSISFYPENAPGQLDIGFLVDGYLKEEK